VCLLGDRLLALDKVMLNGSMMCIKNSTGPLYQHYCSLTNVTTGEWTCDPYFEKYETRLLRGIPGLGSGVFGRELSLINNKKFNE
jgi:potassium/chloride transporter 4/5/6